MGYAKKANLIFFYKVTDKIGLLFYFQEDNNEMNTFSAVIIIATRSKQQHCLRIRLGSLGRQHVAPIQPKYTCVLLPEPLHLALNCFFIMFWLYITISWPNRTGAKHRLSGVVFS